MKTSATANASRAGRRAAGLRRHRSRAAGDRLAGRGRACLPRAVPPRGSRRGRGGRRALSPQAGRPGRPTPVKSDLRLPGDYGGTAAVEALLVRDVQGINDPQALPLLQGLGADRRGAGEKWPGLHRPVGLPVRGDPPVAQGDPLGDPRQRRLPPRPGRAARPCRSRPPALDSRRRRSSESTPPRASRERPAPVTPTPTPGTTAAGTPTRSSTPHAPAPASRPTRSRPSSSSSAAPSEKQRDGETQERPPIAPIRTKSRHNPFGPAALRILPRTWCPWFSRTLREGTRMHYSCSRHRLLLAPVLAVLAVNAAGCQSTRTVDQKSVPRLQSYDIDPQARPRNGPGEGWMLLRRMGS